MPTPEHSAEKDAVDAEHCPACKAAPGEPCHVPIAGVDTTGWHHDARILAPVIRDLREAREDAWQRFLHGPGGTTEALRQGRVDGLDAALKIIKETRRA